MILADQEDSFFTGVKQESPNINQRLLKSTQGKHRVTYYNGQEVALSILGHEVTEVVVFMYYSGNRRTTNSFQLFKNSLLSRQEPKISPQYERALIFKIN